MRISRVFLGTVFCLSLLSTHVQAEPYYKGVQSVRVPFDTLDDAELKSCFATVEEVQRKARLNNGDIVARADTVRRLEYRSMVLRRTKDEDEQRQAFGGLECNVMTLSHFYNARAGRQQSFMDMGTQGSTIALFTSAFSSGAGRVTQGYWAAAGLVPVVLAEFNANEPVRDLYHAGSNIVDFISARYRQLWLQVQYIRDIQVSPHGPGRYEFDLACDEVRNLVGTEVLHWPETSADRTLMIGETTRIVAACDQLRVRLSSFEILQRRLGAIVNNEVITQAYARDVLNLDQQLLTQDRGLNYTPYQSVKSLMASPFFFVGSLLSNEDARGAIDKIALDRAIKGMELRLTGIDLSGSKALDEITPLDPVRPELKSRVAIIVAYETKDSMGKKTRHTTPMISAVPKLERAVFALNRAYISYNYAASLSKQVFGLANGGKIKVVTTPATKKVEILFEPTT